MGGLRGPCLWPSENTDEPYARKIAEIYGDPKRHPQVWLPRTSGQPGLIWLVPKPGSSWRADNAPAATSTSARSSDSVPPADSDELPPGFGVNDDIVGFERHGALRDRPSCPVDPSDQGIGVLDRRRPGLLVVEIRRLVPHRCPRDWRACIHAGRSADDGSVIAGWPAAAVSANNIMRGINLPSWDILQPRRCPPPKAHAEWEAATGEKTQ